MNIARSIVSVAFWITAFWNGLLVIGWNIAFFANFVPRLWDVILGLVLLEVLPIIFVVSWVMYGFSSVLPLLTRLVVGFVAMYLGGLLWPKWSEFDESE
ncbi:hypothetical protein MYX78_10850 [Acidobacteria bacterium AH-259-G07]|nr:hypothetical protein [Acidobacteria bacterium AH-259-G07]